MSSDFTVHFNFELPDQGTKRADVPINANFTNIDCYTNRMMTSFVGSTYLGVASTVIADPTQEQQGVIWMQSSTDCTASPHWLSIKAQGAGVDSWACFLGVWTCGAAGTKNLPLMDLSCGRLQVPCFTCDQIWVPRKGEVVWDNTTGEMYCFQQTGGAGVGTWHNVSCEATGGSLNHDSMAGLAASRAHTEYLYEDGSADLTGHMEVTANKRIDHVDISASIREGTSDWYALSCFSVTDGYEIQDFGWRDGTAYLAAGPSVYTFDGDDTWDASCQFVATCDTSGTLFSLFNYGDDLWAGDTKGNVYRLPRGNSTWELSCTFGGHDNTVRSFVDYDRTLFALVSDKTGTDACKVYEYDRSGDSWAIQCDFTSSSCWLSVGKQFGKNLYVAGEDDIWKWDNKQWSLSCSLSGLRWDGLTTFRGELYAFGYKSGGSRVLKLDRDGDWSCSADIVASSDIVGSVSYAGNMYYGYISPATGGRIVRYDPYLAEWSSIAFSGVLDELSAMRAVGGEFYHGGRDDSDDSTVCRVYAYQRPLWPLVEDVLTNGLRADTSIPIQDSLPVSEGGTVAGVRLNEVLRTGSAGWEIDRDSYVAWYPRMVPYRNKLYGMGLYYNTNHGIVTQYDGENWTISTDITGGEFWAGEVFNNYLYACLSGTGVNGQILKFDGTTWTVSCDLGTAYSVWRDAAVHGGYLYVMGTLGGSAAKIYRCSSSDSWALHCTTTPQRPYSFGVYNETLYMITDQRRFYSLNTTTDEWDLVGDLPTDLLTLGPVYGNKLWSFGWGGAYYYDGSTWTLSCTTRMFDAEIYGGLLYSTGFADSYGTGAVYYYDGKEWATDTDDFGGWGIQSFNGELWVNDAVKSTVQLHRRNITLGEMIRNLENVVYGQLGAGQPAKRPVTARAPRPSVS